MDTEVKIALKLLIYQESDVKWMKNTLLKIARWINKKYGVKVELEDKFNFKGQLYYIVDITLKQELDCLDELTITSHDVGVTLKQLKQL